MNTTTTIKWLDSKMVRWLGIRIFLPIFLSIHLTTFSYGAFNDFGVGAKTIGLGSVYTAVGDDIYAAFYNPAGLSYLKRGQLATEYGKLHLNLSDDSNLYNGFIGVGYPFIREEIVEKKVLEETTQQLAESTTTVTEKPFRVETSITRTLSSAFMVGYKTYSLMDVYSENTLLLTYSRFFGRNISVGVTLKSLSDRFTIDEYLKKSEVFDYGQKVTKTVYTFDIGAMVNPIPHFYLGISALNINEPDMGYLKEDRVPSFYKIGLGMRKKDSKFGLDVTLTNKNTEISFGTEKSVGNFDIRGGLSYTHKSRYSSVSEIAAGFSVHPTHSISIDYAINYPVAYLKNTYGSHWLSFTFKFGKIPSEELEPGSLERAYKKLEEEKTNLENKLAAVEREKRKLEEILIEEATTRIRERIKQAKEVPPPEKVVEPSKVEVVPAKTVTATRTHLVRKGDTLQSLAEKYYNDPKLWIEIYNANKEYIGRGGALKVNQVLVIPPLSKATPARPSPQEPPASTVTPQPLKETTLTPEPTTPKIEEIKVEPVVQVTTPTVMKEIPKPPSTEVKSIKHQPSKPKTHIVKAGENLRIIAEKYYNNPEKWKDILEANKNKIIRGQIRPGMELVIP